jgi:hypothetical protein
MVDGLRTAHIFIFAPGSPPTVTMLDVGTSPFCEIHVARDPSTVGLLWTQLSVTDPAVLEVRFALAAFDGGLVPGSETIVVSQDRPAAAEWLGHDGERWLVAFTRNPAFDLDIAHISGVAPDLRLEPVATHPRERIFPTHFLGIIDRDRVAAAFIDDSTTQLGTWNIHTGERARLDTVLPIPLHDLPGALSISTDPSYPAFIGVGAQNSRTFPREVHLVSLTIPDDSIGTDDGHGAQISPD